jgi:5-methyltetrahydrofolate--homocysteine methyltransferase
MLPIVSEMLAASHLPLLVKPNAGLPREENGKTVFDVSGRDFTEVMEEMLDMGVAVIGGCCGTTPEYIGALRKMLDRREREGKNRRVPRGARALPSACSATRTVPLDGSRMRVVGERLNPTGKSRMKQALRDRDYDYIEDEALAQLRAGADILEINVGMPETDEGEIMPACVRRLESGTDAPLMIDCTDAGVIEKAVRLCRGKPIINSVNGEQRRMDEIFPIAKKYGTAVVALLLDENGIPDSADARLAILEKIIKEAKNYGIQKERLIVDCLALTVSAQQDACRETLEAIRAVRERHGLRCTLGVSNISFGLPERSLINRTFLSMAMLAGLDTPILDPTNRDYMDAVRSGEVLLGKDRDSADYIGYTAKRPKPNPPRAADTPPPSAPSAPSSGAASAYGTGTLDLRAIIRQGFESRAAAAAEKLLESALPMDIIEPVILPALERVGDDYESGEIFLPQMIKSAETAKNAMKVLRGRMSVQGETISYGRIILATVKDDIHDIGKNIVKIVMENYGYEIIDLGKDVPPETIVKTAKEQGIRMVGLSALMTTTVVNMEKTIALLKSEGLDCMTVVGGAVLNADYAEKIGADRYCRTAMDAVRAANRLFNVDPDRSGQNLPGAAKR